MDITNHKLLFACGEEGGGVAGLVQRSGKLITWVQPGGRQRAYEIRRVLEDSEESFVFEDKHGRRFELFPLTPAYFNKYLRRRTDPRYKNERELLEAFEESLR